MFPITPDVLHRIEFRSIGRQVVQRQAAPLAGDKFPDQVAAMSLGAIPDYQQSARQMTQQVREKVHHLWGADGLSVKPRIKGPPHDAGGSREHLPVERILAPGALRAGPSSSA